MELFNRKNRTNTHTAELEIPTAEPPRMPAQPGLKALTDAWAAQATADRDAFEKWCTALAKRIEPPDADELDGLQAALVSAEADLAEVLSARDQHRKVAPQVNLKAVDDMTPAELVALGATGTAATIAAGENWSRADRELQRRIILASQKVHELRGAIGKCKAAPVRKYADQVADRCEAAWKKLEDELAELTRAERLVGSLTASPVVPTIRASFKRV